MAEEGPNMTMMATEPSYGVTMKKIRTRIKVGEKSVSRIVVETAWFPGVKSSCFLQFLPPLCDTGKNINHN